MISSWRGVAIAGVVAGLLAIAVIVDLGRARTTADRSLVPRFDPERVTELIWERTDQPTLHAVRAGATWQIRAPSSAPADPDAISDVLAALRGARWHRRGGAPPVRATLTIVAGSDRYVLGIGAPISGTDQSWMVDGSHGLLVDSWVARALDRDLLGLRNRTPLGDVRRAQTIVIEGGSASSSASLAPGALRIEGTPRRLVRPVELLLAANISDDLERALGELAIVRLPGGPGAARGLAISLAGSAGAGGPITVEIGGSCPGAPELVLMSGTAGDGCVDHLAAAAIERAIRALRQPPAAIVERRPSSFEPRRIVLADGAALELSPPRVGDRPADPARVEELLFALAAPAEVVALPAKPAVQHVVVTDRAGSATTLDLFADRVLARHGEPVALRPSPGAWRLLVRPSRDVRDLTLWLEEPTTITELRIDGVTYQRGAVIGAWTRQPTGPVDARTVEALVAALAAPRARGFFDEWIATVHRVRMTITPPAGPSTERTVEVGPMRAAGCPVRVERDALILPTIVCTQIASLAKE